MKEAVAVLKEQLHTLDTKRTALAIALEALIDKKAVKRGRKPGRKKKGAAVESRDAAPEAPAPKKRGRPAKVAVEEAAG